LNGRGGKEAIGFDEIVSQFEPDDPKGMGRPVIIIEISVCIDEGGFQNDPLGFSQTVFGPMPQKRPLNFILTPTIFQGFPKIY
jgi:hypothetical protein